MIAVPDTAIVPRMGRQRLIIGSDFLTERQVILPDGRQLITNVLTPAEVASEVTSFFTEGVSLGDAVMGAITSRVERFYYPPTGRYGGDNATLGVIELGEAGVVAVGGRSRRGKGRSRSRSGRGRSRGRSSKSSRTQKKLKHRSRRNR